MHVELKIDGEPFVLYRCGSCERSQWTKNGVAVPFEAVSGAMAAETAKRPLQTPRVRRTRAT